MNKVPVMLGVNSGEHIMFSTDILNNLTLLDKYSQVRFHLGIRYKYKYKDKYKDILNKLTILEKTVK